MPQDWIDATVKFKRIISTENAGSILRPVELAMVRGKAFN